MAEADTKKAARSGEQSVRGSVSTSGSRGATRPAGSGAQAAEPGPRPGEDRVVRLHHLRPAPGSKKARTRVGRGEGSKGKTAGRGTKGTKARRQVRPGFEGGQMPLHMRLPKLRGFRNPNRVEYQPVNVGRVAELFPAGGAVTVDDLVAAGAVRKGHLVKVLGGGDVTVALNVTADAWSGSAKEKIEAAGGTIVAR